MLEMIEVTNTNDSLATDFPPETTDPQTELGETITSLWVAHANAKIASRVTNQELRVLRAKLGEQLWEMKKLLAKPGCDGQWSGFLRERGIPRATGDRLVARHLRSLDPKANCATEELSEPTDEDVQKLFASVWPKLRRTLRSQQSVDFFVHLLTAHCECGKVTAHEIPAVMLAAATFVPASSGGDSLVEPESYDALPLETDQRVASAP